MPDTTMSPDAPSESADEGAAFATWSCAAAGWANASNGIAAANPRSKGDWRRSADLVMMPLITKSALSLGAADIDAACLNSINLIENK
jgi:hypothetical protein